MENLITTDPARPAAILTWDLVTGGCDLTWIIDFNFLISFFTFRLEVLCLFINKLYLILNLNEVLICWLWHCEFKIAISGVGCWQPYLHFTIQNTIVWNSPVWIWNNQQHDTGPVVTNKFSLGRKVLICFVSVVDSVQNNITLVCSLKAWVSQEKDPACMELLISQIMASLSPTSGLIFPLYVVPIIRN